jgi:hypothetical protein
LFLSFPFQEHKGVMTLEDVLLGALGGLDRLVGQWRTICLMDSRRSPGDTVGLDTICLDRSPDTAGLDRSTGMVGFDLVGFDVVGSSSREEGVGLVDAHGRGGPLLLLGSIAFGFDKMKSHHS